MKQKANKWKIKQNLPKYSQGSNVSMYPPYGAHYYWNYTHTQKKTFQH